MCRTVCRPVGWSTTAALSATYDSDGRRQNSCDPHAPQNEYVASATS